MKKSEYDRLRNKLRRAEKAAQDLSSSKSFEDDADAWKDFLYAANGVYEMLNKSLKSHKKGNPWMGRKNNERKSDDLLHYLQMARDSEEHGLEEVVAKEPSAWWITGDCVINGVISSKTGTRLSVSQIAGGCPIGFGTKRAHAELVPVTTRGVTYAVPTKHLEREIDRDEDEILGRAPLSMARLAILHLQNLVEEAKQFVEMG